LPLLIIRQIKSGAAKFSIVVEPGESDAFAAGNHRLINANRRFVIFIKRFGTFSFPI
jgi:hypothetical protein